MSQLIETHNISVAYDRGKPNEVWALRNVTASVHEEEYVVFFGPSGCGKSTLLYVIAGLEVPAEGTVSVLGRDLSTLSENEQYAYHHSSVGMVFQAYHLIPNLTVRDNILLPQMFAGTKNPSRADELMERFEIAHLADRKPSKLSGGQQQRVAIARSLINDPPIILADEPVGNLDSKNAEIVIDLLSELNTKDKKTVILVTHDPAYLDRGHRVFYMKDGVVEKMSKAPKRKQAAGEGSMPQAEIDSIQREFPSLSIPEIMAKFLFRHVALPFPLSQQQAIEKYILEYINGELSDKELYNGLNNSPEDGGLNLYSQTARNITDRIVRIKHEIQQLDLYRKESTQKLTLKECKEKAKQIRLFLAETYEGKLSANQTTRLDDAIVKRINGTYQSEEFQKHIDKPIKDGGVGLNRRTAETFTREVEVLLVSFETK